MTPSIQSLPVELLHRIFDNLDVETIVLSIRPVCRLFRSVVQTYNRYTLNGKSMSKSNFYLLCRLIHPSSIVSLTLSNDKTTSDQIDLFISLVHLQQLTQLRWLTLLQIDANQLNSILKHININSLYSFSFTIKDYDDTYEITTSNLLSSVIAQSSLRKLNVNMSADRILDLPWPDNCRIEYLTIDSRLNMNQLYRIIEYCPQLHTLVMKTMPTIVSNNLDSTHFRQLTSLTVTEFNTTVVKVEFFLLLTPSLTYLQLVGNGNLMDGQRWERFIERNLLQLTKFEFYFIHWRSTVQTLADVQLIVASFQTPFWNEHKKWYITCENLKECPYQIYLSSLPYCDFSALYTPKTGKISMSTYPLMTNNGVPMADSINMLYLSLNESMANEIVEKTETMRGPLFPNAISLNLDFYHSWPFLSLESLFIFINISRIISMNIIIGCPNKFNENVWLDAGIFMEQAPNLSTLIIQDSHNTYINTYSLATNNMYSNLPRHIKHLEMPINDLNQIKMVLNRCKNLSTIKFYHAYVEFSQTITSWFLENTTQTTCKEDGTTTSVWLGKNLIC